MTLSKEMDYLVRSLSCVTHRGDQHTYIEINEDDRNAILKKVKLKASNGDWFCFSPDKGTKCQHIHPKATNIVVMSPLLTIGDDFKHHCACDAVIIS